MILIDMLSDRPASQGAVHNVDDHDDRSTHQQEHGDSGELAGRNIEGAHDRHEKQTGAHDRKQHSKQTRAKAASNRGDHEVVNGTPPVGGLS
jgi:hypothetical protein